MKRVAMVIAVLSLASAFAADPKPLPEWDAAAATLVVFNPDFPESQELANYYAGKRSITADHVIGLKCATTEAITREGFDEQLRLPLQKLFAERHWWEASSRMFIVALMHGIPSKINRKQDNPKASQEDEASVDSELALLGAPPPRLAGALPNAYFGKTERFNVFSKAEGMLLVCRLDAASPATVRRMIDDAVSTEQTGLLGRGVIDLALKKGAYDEGDEWLRRSAKTYRDNGIPVYVDRYEPVLREDWPLPDTALYFGWYTGQIAGALKSPSFQFKKGAVACHLHSFSASTIRTATDAWVGPILEHGAAATMGNVWEPYLTLTIHFDVLNERLLQGYTLAEAAWCATPGLSWQNVVLGDPLYRPFKITSMGTGADKDYSLYKGVAKRHAGEKDAKALKDDILHLAEKHDSIRMLELLALLSSLDGKVEEAVEVAEHVLALSKDPGQRLRLVLYESELLRRNHEPAKEQAALQMLQQAATDDTLKEVSGYYLIKTMLHEMGH